MAVTLKCLLRVDGKSPRWDWDRQEEEQQPEIAADIAAISASSPSSPGSLLPLLMIGSPSNS
jgi:hypothetical protein